MDEFFVTLLSNSSMQFFPDNKTSSFTVQLAEKITLNGSWSVGLAEIHYNYNFFNVTSNNNSVVAVKKKLELSEKSEYSSDDMCSTSGYHRPVSDFIRTVKITPGYYASVSDLIDTVNTEMKNHDLVTMPFISIDKINNRSVVKKESVRKSIESISFEGRLAMQLGFEPDENILNQTISPHIGNTFFGVPDQMLIYTDIIEPTFIGHEKAYVMKIVNTNVHTYKFGDICYREYTHIHYMRVQKREFESVSVDIRDYTGAFIPFQHGVLTIKLHFKKNGSQ